MLLIIILGAVVLLAILVVGFLYYMLTKESTDDQQKVVAVKDVSEFRKSFSHPEEIKPLEAFQVPLGGETHSLVAPPEPSQENKEFLVKEEEYQKQVKELEEQLQAIAVKAQNQSEGALATIEELKKENEQLKSEQSNRITSAEANLIKTQDTIGVMREEQVALQSRLTESQEQARKLEEEIVFMKQQMAQEVVKTKTETDQLVVDNKNLQRSLESISAEATKNFQEEMNALRQENQTFKNAAHDLTMTNQKLKELNGHLIEKSEALQWELTKARAQMTGFERACDNYQGQLQDVFHRTGSMEQNYSRLNETNNRLQNVLDELQKQNEELSKRERIFESELEKNRNQLVSLEREHEQLKATIKTQQQE